MNQIFTYENGKKFAYGCIEAAQILVASVLTFFVLVGMAVIYCII